MLESLEKKYQSSQRGMVQDKWLPDGEGLDAWLLVN